MAKKNLVKRVRDCMTCDPATVGPNDSLQRVIELLRRRDIRSVPVLEEVG
jgi:CBS domain-containing protein